MGYEYIQWVLPDPQSMDFAPSSAMVAALVSGLEARDWLASPLGLLRLRHPVGGQPQSVKVERADLSPAIGSLLDRSGAVLAELPVAEPPADMEVDSPYDTITASRCYAAELLLSKTLCFVPSDGVQDGKLVCPGCGADLSAQLECASFTNVWQQFWHAREVPIGAGARCQACSTSLPSANIWHHTQHSGTHSPKDRAPFFRFALRLTDGGPTVDPALLDPGLASLLEETTRVRFRSCGRWV